MKTKLFQIFIYVFVGSFSLVCVLPFIMVLAGSLSNERDIATYGFVLFPKHIDFISYRILFLDKSRIFNAYRVSISVTLFGTILSLLINSLMAYALARKSLKYRKFFNFFTLITILFSGGMVPWFIVCKNILHLYNNIYALILPNLANAWYIFLLRNFAQSIPEEMHESAKIDGAGEYTIFFKIILRLMTPALATIGLFTALDYWNNWWLGLMLIDKQTLQPLQLLLRTIVSNIQFIKSSPNAGAISQIAASLPSEGIKMATCIITLGPIVLLYPILQRFFVKGIMLGAVKS